MLRLFRNITMDLGGKDQEELGFPHWCLSSPSWGSDESDTKAVSVIEEGRP